MKQAKTYSDFVLCTVYEDIPADVVERAKDLILDLIAVSAAAHAIKASKLGRETAVRLFNSATEDDKARILFDGRTASIAGAAYAGATQIDNLDAHDGYSSAKGHAGCGLFPAVLAFAEKDVHFSGRDLLTSMVIGYEIGCRAGLALHGTVTDYHSSGAWISLAVAALGVRLNGADRNTLRHAIGIAEYYGPRSQMMREIDNPTMLHDGSGWGSMVGVVAAELALAGFEGAPAITIEGDSAAEYWRNLASDWLTSRQNIKLFPVCRWAHAPIQAALDLRSEHAISVNDIKRIEIHAFHEATRLAQDMPETTSKAQYSICYPVAAALTYGKLGAREVSGETFADPDIAKLVSLTAVAECPECNESFPQDRLGRTIIETRDGRRLDSGIVRAPGEHTNPVDRMGIIDKYREYVFPVLGCSRAKQIEETVFMLDRNDMLLNKLTDLLYPVIE
ncbi:MAG: MmgE/PrpD family protein [Gammaproteobacteria bacterium]|nr:MmgE/PrpD family protein [Gammaproteobacteria bacterium]